MQVGMIGLGRMGANMVSRLLGRGHQFAVFDVHPEPIVDLVREGAVGGTRLDEFLDRLKPPRVIWLMVPAAVVDQTIEQLARSPRRRGHPDRRRQLLLPRRHRRAAALKPEGHPLRGCRDERRRLGPGARATA